MELSPLRPNENATINQALADISNPFGNNLLMPVTPAHHSSFNENRLSIPGSTAQNRSLPLHLTPERSILPPMERSLNTAYGDAMRTVMQQESIQEENLFDVSDPFSASMDNAVQGQLDYEDEALENISAPFSDSFAEIAHGGNQPMLPIQAVNEFAGRFDINENLSSVSIKLDDDEMFL